MSLYDVFQNLRDLVEQFEGLIEKGKTAVSTRSVDLINEFINSAEESFQQVTSILSRSRDILQEPRQSDALLKYTSVYYRMLVLVSIPYVIDILESASSILRNRNLEGNANRALVLAEKFKSFVDTLKRQ